MGFDRENSSETLAGGSKGEPCSLGDRVYSFLQLVAGTETVAEGAFAKTASCLFRSQEDLSEDEIFRIALSQLIDACAQQSATEEEILSLERINADALSADVLLQKALRRLSFECRTTFILHDVFQFSRKSAAKISGLNEPQLRIMLSRARLTLQRFLQHNMGDIRATTNAQQHPDPEQGAIAQ